MLPTSRCAWFSLLGLLLLMPLAEAQLVDHHPPYQDPHFDLHHTPRYDYGARPMYRDDGAHASCTAGSASCGICNGDGVANVRGSRSPACPPLDTATLQLWVPDHDQVEINGQPTSPQTLGGIHRNSRIFLLDGLEANQLSPCEIVVTRCDEFGVTTSNRYEFCVAAGQRYRVRYPRGFAPCLDPYPAFVDGSVPAVSQ